MAEQIVITAQAIHQRVMGGGKLILFGNGGSATDANDWAIETMNNPKYPLELLLRVVTVSLETMKIVNALPAMDI